MKRTIYLCKLVNGSAVRINAENDSEIARAIQTDDTLFDVENKIINCRYIVTAEAWEQREG